MTFLILFQLSVWELVKSYTEVHAWILLYSIFTQYSSIVIIYWLASVKWRWIGFDDNGLFGEFVTNRVTLWVRFDLRLSRNSLSDNRYLSLSPTLNSAHKLRMPEILCLWQCVTCHLSVVFDGLRWASAADDKSAFIFSIFFSFVRIRGPLYDFQRNRFVLVSRPKIISCLASNRLKVNSSSVIEIISIFSRHFRVGLTEYLKNMY